MRVVVLASLRQVTYDLSGDTLLKAMVAHAGHEVSACAPDHDPETVQRV